MIEGCRTEKTTVFVIGWKNTVPVVPMFQGLGEDAVTVFVNATVAALTKQPFKTFKPFSRCAPFNALRRFKSSDVQGSVQSKTHAAGNFHVSRISKSRNENGREAAVDSKQNGQEILL